MNKLVSVIMSAYNENHEEIRLAIESILNQTYQNLEFIIVLDNPKNEVLYHILNEYEKKDQRVKVIVNQQNLGLAQSLNIANQHAKGEYIARMDADDICVLHRLERQISFLEENRMYDVVASNKFEIDEIGLEIPTNYQVPNDERQLKKLLRYGNPIVHPSVVIRKSTFQNIGGYRNFPASQDYDLWLRMITSGYKIYVLSEKLLYYRIRKNGISFKNPYRQYIYSKYARLLFKQRLRNGKDDYSESNLKKFLYKYESNEHLKKIKYYDSILHLREGITNIKKGNIVTGVKVSVKSLFSHSELKNVLYLALLYKFTERNVKR